MNSDSLRGETLQRLLAWSFGLLLALLPVAHVRGAQSSMIGVSVLLFIAWAVWSRATFLHDVPAPIAKGLAAWVGITTLSCAWSPEPWRSLEQLGESVWLPAIFFLLAFALGTNKRRFISTFSLGLGAGLAILCGAALSALALGEIWILKTGGGAGLATHPLMRWYPGPGLASTFVLFALPAVYWGWRAGGPFRGGWAVLICALILTGAATLNRMFGLVLVLGSVALYFGYPAHRDEGRRPWVLWAGGGLLLLVGFGVVVASSAVRTSGSLAHLNWDAVKSVFLADPRFALWQVWFSQGWSHAPLLGTGYGKEVARHVYAQALTSAVAQGVDSAAPTHPHNLLLSIWIQTGLLGVAGFLALIGSMVVTVLRLSRQHEAVRHVSAALLALIAVLVFKNLTDDFYDRVPAIYFWSCFGFMLGHGVLAAKEARERLHA